MAKGIRAKATRAETDIERDLVRSEPRLLSLGVGLGLVFIGAAATAIGLLSIAPSIWGPNDPQLDTAAGNGAAVKASFAPPTMADIPEGPEGEAIRRGMQIFNMTYAAEDSKQYVGNGMACTNCHIDGGRKADSAPMWAAWGAYPQYRKKNKQINTMTDRIKGCFTYSMNAQDSPAGRPPPEDGDVYRNLEIYFAWLAKGAPQYGKLKGGGYAKLDVPKGGYDPARGATVYNNVCSGCHAPDGAGAQNPTDGSVLYPALWGPRSYNWGAGMAGIQNAAAFVKTNMPFNQPGMLSEQDAWDVAAYINSQPRPKDPRQTGSIADNAKANFSSFPTYYGTTRDGHVLGTGVKGAPYPKVPTLTGDAGTKDPAVAAMQQANAGS
jgi:thiosulfate dehydrogenase